MLTDTHRQPRVADPIATFRPTPHDVGPPTDGHTVASVRELVSQACLLVAELRLGEGDRWTRATPAVAAVAATLRAAVLDLSVATPALQRARPMDAVPVAATAPPVVRAREIGFLASRLAAVLDLSEHDQIRATMTHIGNRLTRDLGALPGASRTDASAPRPDTADLGSRRRHARPTPRPSGRSCA